jgi:hypothetical protein
MRVRATWIVAASVFLGMISPALAGLGGDFSDPATRHGLFYAWFYVLPVAADLWLWPEGDAQIALAMVVYVLQYLVLFGVVHGLLELSNLVRDFVGLDGHRRDPDSVLRRNG